MSDVDPKTSRVDVEMSLSWAEGHPGLFVKAFREHQAWFPAGEWTSRVDLSRAHFVTLTAIRSLAEVEGVS